MERSEAGADLGCRRGRRPEQGQGAPAHRVAAIGAVAWSTVFASVHVYWAAGGRTGLGNEAPEADAALSTGWFAAYNASVTTLAIVGAAIAVDIVFRPDGRRWVRRLAAIGGTVLLIRGAVGTTGLIVDVVDGGLDDIPTVLVAIEPAFLAGGLAYVTIAHGSTRPAVFSLFVRGRRSTPPTR